MDPRWWAMNILEADIMAGSKYGLGATRFTGAKKVGADVETLTHNRRRLPTTKDTFDDIMPDPFGGQTVPGLDNGYFDNRMLQGYITRSFEKGREVNVERLLDELPANDPLIRRFQEKFPDLPRSDYAKQLDDTLYSFDTKGVKKTVDDVAAASLTPEEVIEMGPMIQRLYEMNDRTYKDIVAMLHGNASRSNLERLGNSYFLYWPLSYQVKAAKWLFGVMTGSSTKGGSLKALVSYDRLREHHLGRLENSPEYRQAFEDHPELWRAAQMFVPITPEDLGVSLSRPVRYLGGMAGVFEEYKTANDPWLAAAKVASMGPIYSIELVMRLRREGSLPFVSE
jgi:hypothetical protein